ncbi:MAG: DNA-3-methyladenine glycosylase [Candidatus Saccharibacteria bacterium]|nr:DNA-3-methyladenine glycosylase [Candidatus Saccharibacteria bacterium]
MSSSLDFLADNAEAVAPKLLGCILERTLGDTKLRARIVETEAYDQTDVASHSYNGETPRTSVMFGEPGYLYVYFTYGMHYCCNIVTGKKGSGAAVLIRAVEPLDGEVVMGELRDGKSGVDLTNGPAKACQALSIDKALNGHNLSTSPLILLPGSLSSVEEIVQTTRIGLSKGTDIPWRFYIRDNPYVSRR